eukprot:2088935-Amphidinium_carterae.1
MAGWTVATEQSVPINPPRQVRRQRRQPDMHNATDGTEGSIAASAARPHQAAGAASAQHPDNHTMAITYSSGHCLSHAG